MIDTAKLSAWKAAIDKATGGEWTQKREEFDSHDAMTNAMERTLSHGGHVMHYIECEQAVFSAVTGNGPTSKANAEFIALARTALPEALAEIERLRILVTRFAPRGGGAGGMTVTSWECLACGSDQVAGSTAHDTVCRNCRRAALSRP